MIGAGVYDDLTTVIRDKTQAEGVVLMIFGGNRGSGFSVQAPAEIMAKLPELLEAAAMGVRSDMEQIEARLRDGK